MKKEIYGCSKMYRGGRRKEGEVLLGSARLSRRFAFLAPRGCKQVEPEETRKEEEGGGTRDEGRGTREEGGGRRDEGGGTRDEGRGRREEGGGRRDEGGGRRDEGRGTRDEGRGTRDEGRGTRDEGRGTRDEGRGTRDDGRGTRDEGRGTRDEGRGTRDEGRGTRDEGSRGLPGCAAPLYVSLRSVVVVVLTTKPGDPRQDEGRGTMHLRMCPCYGPLISKAEGGARRKKGTITWAQSYSLQHIRASSMLPLCERSERADNRLDKFYTFTGLICTPRRAHPPAILNHRFK